MIRSMLAIGLGAILGAWARFGLSLLLNPQGIGLSWGTLTANWLGCFLAGCFLTWLQHGNVNHEWRLFLQVGLLGSLTTFSTFAGETLLMITSQKWVLALLYSLLNGVGSLISVSIGYRLTLLLYL